jgi:hypothetical protein
VGAEKIRGIFADWAAHNTGGLDYLSNAQIERALLEAELVGDSNNLHPYVIELVDQQSNGSFSPPPSLRPRGWSYNVIKIRNTEAARYSFNFHGESTGSEEAAAHFDTRVVIKGNTDTKYFVVEMTSPLEGELTFGVEDTEFCGYYPRIGWER